MRSRPLVPMTLALSLGPVAIAGTISIPGTGAASFQEGNDAISRMRTVGQTFQVPSPTSEALLTSFSFNLTAVPTSFDFQTAIYEWDGSSATGSALYLSGPRSTASTGLVVSDGFSLTLDPAKSYVALLSTQGNGAQFGDEFVQVSIANNTSDPYAGGIFVFQTSMSLSPTWTVDAWNITFTDRDLQFEASFALCMGNEATGDSDGDGICDDVDACFGVDASGDGDSDLVCADVDCDDGNPAVAFLDNCGVCGGDDATCGVFADGFESGSTIAWSSQEPFAPMLLRSR